jgi:hypothetical protein
MQDRVYRRLILVTGDGCTSNQYKMVVEEAYTGRLLQYVICCHPTYCI